VKAAVRTLAILLVLAAYGFCPARSNGAPVVPLSRAAVTAIASLTDSAGHRHKASELTGRIVVLFFFCGCEQCHAVAREWSLEEQSEYATAPGQKPPAPPPITIVDFAGSADEAQQFAADTSLAKMDPSPILLVDPAAKLRPRFRVEQCPQAFVFDRSARNAYSTLAIKDTQAVSPIEIAARCLSAVRRVQTQPENGKIAAEKSHD